MIETSSHCPMLVKALYITKDFPDNSVLEMGMGIFSTSLLHWLCLDQGRKLVSLENDSGYCAMCEDMKTDWHEIRLVTDWEAEDISGPWGVALIDHRPAKRRYQDVKRLADNTSIVVVHDTEEEINKFYAYHRAFVKFKYRYDWIKSKPNTTLLSNFIDFSKEFKCEI